MIIRPFLKAEHRCDDTSTTREKAFAKLRDRVEGMALVEEIINGR